MTIEPTFQSPYTRDELYATGSQHRYTGRHLAEIAFPLGGIGTGSVALGGRGNLQDWEIFGRADKGSTLPFAFFTLRTCRAGEAPMLKVVEAPPLPPFNPHTGRGFSGTGFGVARDTGAGLPHLREATFLGEYPFAHVAFTDPDLPLQVSLEAWNPMIPHNADDSGIPVAILTYTLHNPGDQPVEFTLVGNLPTVALPGTGEIGIRREGALTGLQVAFQPEQPAATGHGALGLVTPWPTVTYETHWTRPEFNFSHFAALVDWSERLLATGRLSECAEAAALPSDIGSLGAVGTLAPGETVQVPFYLCWSFPNFEKRWHDCGCAEGHCEKPTWRHYYAQQFPEAWAAARYTHAHLARLEEETRRFHRALFASTLPSVVLDSISSQMSILKSTTCLRLPDGTFYGFEGCFGDGGCCEGSCTHVWNYAQTHAFLYPGLTRSMREAEYRYSMHPDGKVCFRLQLPLGTPPHNYHACADGQLGAIMQVYRDWQLGAGDAWLRQIWPATRRALEYAWIEWDADRDGLMEGVQHNTYDTELHGPNAMCGVPYLGALRAAAQMADHLGEDDFAAECRRIEAAGAARLDALLFNGEYYIQPYDPAKRLPHQVGPGCLIDQLLGQQLAHVYGLGYLLPSEHVQATLTSILRYNFKADFWNHRNYERIFALNDEAGTVICTWPHGGRPAFPIPYSDEVMIGFEYQFASHLIYEGLLDEGLTVTKAVRDRHDGERRNPWNEFECGNHYARSMANWAIKLALDGFVCEASAGRLGFAPKVSADDFQTFWSTATGWGTYAQRPGAGMFTLTVLYGTQALQELVLADLPDGAVTVTGPHGPVAAARAEKAVHLTAPMTLQAGETLTVRV
jgi:non-lysosomal glucosylceramidase